MSLFFELDLTLGGETVVESFVGGGRALTGVSSRGLAGASPVLAAISDFLTLLDFRLPSLTGPKPKLLWKSGWSSNSSLDFGEKSVNWTDFPLAAFALLVDFSTVVIWRGGVSESVSSSEPGGALPLSREPWAGLRPLTNRFKTGTSSSVGT